MMTLWKPQNELVRWNRELDNFFGWPTRTRMFTPTVDIEELDDAFVITADLPGIKKEEIEIQVENETLTLSGKREQSSSSEDQQNGYRRRERSYGTFSRRFRLGPEVATGEINASYENGVLSLRLPKAEQAKPHRISVH